MAKQRVMTGTEDIVLNLGKLNPKQMDFFNAKTKFTCYGGAKGGGKSHAVIRMAIMYAMNYDGIRVLVIRAHYPELNQNLIEPMLALVPQEIAGYNGTTHVLRFYNGSVIQFGHFSGLESELEYQGQSHDIIFMDEATQFSERTFRHLAGCLRGDNDFPKRFYLTCNPGGVGHFWVKRLFIDRKFKVDREHPEKTENPEQYSFIFARAEDNVIMLQRNPDYLSDISMMANSDAMRYGDWNILGGCYFDNFDETKNVHKSFKIPPHWQLYRSFDYGLDMFCCFWWAVDEDGRCWCIRSFEAENLNVQDAAAACLNHTMRGENIAVTYAPPDMWNRQRETGKTVAELFANYGLPVVRSDNNRVQGHMIVRSMLEPIPLHDPYVIKVYGGKDKAPKELPQLMFFDNIGDAIEDLQSIQHDDNNPNDCAKDPHDLTHSVDGIRYFCINRSLQAVKPEPPKVKDEFMDEEEPEDYETFMTGGEIPQAYIDF